ncbi:hypothetical protein LTR62_007038 [Meristemomyces frigidus]|uniref:Nucleoporin NSP1 n=1 Tax=Meristemomyces frigidus TaxID=1508187 RepID=A0AAN7TB21_9PEZI|nr:hypothetical protein LTR62_007038 [Meristemomyces frigidus]
MSNVFGQPASSSGASGSTPATSGGLFGASTASAFSPVQGTPGSAGLFGSTNGTQSKPLFGAAPASGAAAPSPFGGTTGASSFGGNNNNNNKASGNANMFGSSAAPLSAPSYFGAKPSATPAASPGEQPKAAGGGGFGTQSSSASGSNLFGASASTAQPTWNFPKPAEQGTAANTQSIFSQAGTNTAPAARPLFGAVTPQANKTTPPSFTPAGNPPSTSLFGSNQGTTSAPTTSTQPQQGGGLFGTQPASAPSSAPTFSFPDSAASQAPPAPQATSTSLFAPKTTAQGQSGTTSTSDLFGGASQQQPSSTSTTSAAPSLFSNLSTSSASAQPASTSTTGANLFSSAGGFKLPGAPASSTATQPSANAASAAPSFSLPSASQTSSAAPTSTPAAAPTFSLTKPAASDACQAPSTTAPSGGLFGGATSSQPAPKPSGGGLFGAAASATTTQPAAASSTTTPSQQAGGLFGGASTSAAGLTAGASTTGPAPPQQSRLASKSMDEILTMWSTSLTTHQKTFQQLAQKVSIWDRELVENSSKISTLYGRCFQAERDCSEVERQLSVVEGGQLELESMLERYEGEVDRMLEQAGLSDGSNGMGGVDGERERTYKTAESCATRLSEMHHSLASMIDEINASSASLSNNNNRTSQTTTEDPLAQIVQVLNGHLSQLQAIDQGAAALSGKVQQAQREAGALSTGAGLGGRGEGRGGDWVEGFGRSYLGRR